MDPARALLSVLIVAGRASAGEIQSFASAPIAPEVVAAAHELLDLAAARTPPAPARQFALAEVLGLAPQGVLALYHLLAYGEATAAASAPTCDSAPEGATILDGPPAPAGPGTATMPVAPPSVAPPVLSGAVAPVPGDPRAAAPVLEVPPAFRRYRILGRLGGGGMGEVYRALDLHLERTVALKVMRTEVATEATMRRFRLEAAAMARLRHPNIVPLFDSGEEEGRLYYTMELCEGETLRDVLERMRTIPARAALRIGHEVALGLHHAHCHGIIHRDIKPDNLLLTPAAPDDRAEAPRESEGRLRLGGSSTGRFHALVMDFGLARDTSKPHLTQDGSLLGTLLYMSPEQAGATLELGPASDIYSLGATLYEALAGVPPFSGEGAGEILELIRHVEPAPLSRLVPGLHPDVATVLEKAMAKDPARRYVTAQEFADDLDRILRGEPVHARPSSWAYKAWLRARRHKAAGAAAAVVLATFLTLALVYYWTPGTLSLTVTPPGALIRIGRRTWNAPPNALPVELAAGAYEVEVSHPDYAPEAREIHVERGRSKDLTLHLRHDQGTLAAESEPVGSEIEVDGVAYGSRVRNLALDTGPHVVRARAPGHFERTTTVEVKPGASTDAFLWLEPAVVWMERTESGLGGDAQMVPDLDGDGLPEIMTHEFNTLAFRRASDGRTTWSSQVASSTYYHAVVLDLGGDVGRVALVATEEKTGLVVLCLDPRRPPEQALRWRFVGPARDWTHVIPALAVPVGDRNGDGVVDVAVNGRDQRLRVLDGRTGKELAQYALPVHALVLAPLEPAHPDRLLFAGSPTRRDAQPVLSGPDAPATAGCLRLSDGALEWTADLGPAQAVATRDLEEDGKVELYAWSKDGFRVLDGCSGRPRWSAAGAGPAPENPSIGWTDVDGDGVADALLAARDVTLTVLSGRDGRPIWRAGDPRVRPVVSAGTVQRLPSGELLTATEDSLAVLDPRTGSVRWRAPGRYGSVALLDGDGDGRPDLVAGLKGVGLVCLDDQGRRRWTVHFEQDVNPLGSLGDLDGDGLAEILVAGNNSQIGVLRGPRKLWVRRAGAALLATPIVGDLDGDGRLAVVSLGRWGQDRSLVCLDGATGRLRWARTESCTPNRGPSLADLDGDGRPDLVFIGGDPRGPFVWAFRGSDGRPVWEFPRDPGEVYSAAAVCDLDGDGVPDLAFQRWGRQDVVAIDGRRKRLLWRHPVGGYAMGGVGTADLDGDGRPDVVAPFMDGYVYALGGRDGRLLWRTEIDNGSRCAPTLEDVIEDGVPDVLLLSRIGTLWVLDGRAGRPVWRLPHRAQVEPWGRPAVARLPDGRTLILAPQGAGGVVAIDWQRRREVWRAPADKVVIASPIVCDLDGDGRAEVVVGTCDGEVHVLDLATGRRLWAQKVGNEVIEADPGIADLDGDGVLDVVVADHAGALSALSGRPTLGARRR